ncbi:invertebrate-type lysozyme-like [Oratosquilla oratoria]|uniref:invertebrate-type lysozyme-like n=1 Tax=Oratosquilla oratoria TaxID=337810 RepID=UPI003F777C6C
MMIRFLLVAVALATTMTTTTTSAIGDDCLACMCYVSSSGCKIRDPVCRGDICGPFGITEPYWIDAGRPGKIMDTCMKNWECNKETVHNYLNRYVSSPYATCETYARVHYGGPSGASADYTLYYWNEVQKCLEDNLYPPPLPSQ